MDTVTILIILIAIVVVVFIGIKVFDELNHKKIKCNISSSGDRIYHMPEDRLYCVTKIDPSKGEFYARTETEAMEKGFTRSKVR